ncbi:MAG: HPr family phosphocarrier protein [Oscillospiraceae bacterium]
MKSFEYTIKDKSGMHMRPAGLLSKEGKKFKSIITVQKEEKISDITKLISVMSMGIKCGETITISAEGEDEEEAFNSIKMFFETNL